MYIVLSQYSTHQSYRLLDFSVYSPLPLSIYTNLLTYCCMVLIIIWWWWCKILVLPPFYFWYPRLRDSYENGALMTLSVRGEQPNETLDTIFGLSNPPAGSLQTGRLAGDPSMIVTLSYRSLPKLIATDLVTHPVTCVIDIYIHMFTWLLFWGLGGICWIKNQC